MAQPGFDIDKWVADAKAKAVRYQEMRTQAEAISVTETSADGLVTVTVDSGGNVTDLRITDEVSRLRGSEVASAVLQTLHRAQAKLPEKIGDVMRTTIGDDQSTINTVVDRFRTRFPEPEPEDSEPPTPESNIGTLEEDPRPTPPPQPAPPAASSDEDDDYEQGSIWGNK